MPTKLQIEIVQLRRMILSMAASVEQRLNVVLNALIDRDYEAARAVRHGDKVIDAREIEIEEECLRVLALSQPVATDLRFILAVLRINSDLERIADLAKNIAKRVLDLQEAPAFQAPDALVEMAKFVRKMVGDTLNAMANEDAETCRRIRRDDQRLDDLQKEIFVWAHCAIPEDVNTTQGAIDILSVTRAMERIGDLATNIAEDVIFLVEGSLVRHSRK